MQQHARNVALACGSATFNNAAPNWSNRNWCAGRKKSWNKGAKMWMCGRVKAAGCGEVAAGRFWGRKPRGGGYGRGREEKERQSAVI